MGLYAFTIRTVHPGRHCRGCLWAGECEITSVVPGTELDWTTQDDTALVTLLYGWGHGEWAVCYLSAAIDSGYTLQIVSARKK